MGTGNDGADSPDLARALDLLIHPSRIEYTPALRLIPAQGGPAASGPADNGSKSPYLAFNILSVGLDAFVTHMTNKMKGKLPGDFYKLWVDIASLLYDSLYTVDFLDVRALDGNGGEVRSFREKLLLLAVGASGHRTYGSQKKILPDDRNVCALKQMPLSRKLALKGLFSTGTHIDKPEAILFNAHRVEFSGSHPMLAQMDGETILLQREDFPAAIELTEPVIPVLRLAQ
jgi:diacylglycerol kinase family enzyme